MDVCNSEGADLFDLTHALGGWDLGSEEGAELKKKKKVQ
jgi:hypothetical protein